MRLEIFYEESSPEHTIITIVFFYLPILSVLPFLKSDPIKLPLLESNLQCGTV